MSENNFFTEEEIIWAKIEGYPWWPSIILSKKNEPESNEEIYSIILLGTNIKSNISKVFISKFEKNFKLNSKTKNKDLINIIKQAKEIYEMKDPIEKNKKIKDLILKSKNEAKENNINESSSETSNTKEKKGKPKKHKLKKIEDKVENDLIYKI